MRPRNDILDNFIRPKGLIYTWRPDTGFAQIGFETSHGFISIEDYEFRKKFGGNKSIHKISKHENI